MRLLVQLACDSLVISNLTESRVGGFETTSRNMPRPNAERDASGTKHFPIEHLASNSTGRTIVPFDDFKRTKLANAAFAADLTRYKCERERSLTSEFEGAFALFGHIVSRY